MDIYIGCGETDAMRIISRIAKQMQTEYPHVKFHLRSGKISRDF